MTPFERAVEGELEGSRGGRAHVHCRTITATALHRDDGFGSGAGVTRIYTDAVRGCLFVDLSVDAGVAAGRAG
ncbi:hypothetical protein, partial [Calidifontibacter indicus]|uniref:hypothetical protein n=1 Tax=Calidifontibacter indicus TaxID=419650 RepID=UPI003D73743B